MTDSAVATEKGPEALASILNAPFKAKAPPRMTKKALKAKGKKVVTPVDIKPKPKKKGVKKMTAKKASKKATKKAAKKNGKPITQGEELKSRMIRVDAKFADYLGREAARLTREKKEHHSVTDVSRLLHTKLAK